MDRLSNTPSPQPASPPVPPKNYVAEPLRRQRQAESKEPGEMVIAVEPQPTDVQSMPPITKVHSVGYAHRSAHASLIFHEPIPLPFSPQENEEAGPYFTPRRDSPDRRRDDPIYPCTHASAVTAHVQSRYRADRKGKVYPMPSAGRYRVHGAIYELRIG